MSGSTGFSALSDDPAVWAAQRRAMFAQGLMQQASDSSATRSPWQAAARAAAGLLGGYETNQAQNEMQKYAQGSRDAVAGMYSSAPLPGQPLGAAPGAGGSAPPAPLPIQGGAAPATPSAPPGGGAASPALTGFLSQRESGGNPQAKNSQGYTGQFQLGTPDLQSAGMYTPAPGENLNANNWQGQLNIPGFPQVKTQADLLNNPAAQQVAFNGTVAFNDRLFQRNGAYDKIGQTINGVPITRDGLLAGAHLGGVGGVMHFLNGTGNPADSNGTSVSNYIAGAARFQPQGVQVAAANTGSMNDASPPPGGQPAPGASMPGQDANAAAVAYGAQIAQQYRQRAIAAAQSPYAAVRAMAPQFMQQATGAMQYGRWQTTTNPNTGQMMVTDRLGQEPPKPIGDAPKFMADAAGNIVNPANPGVGGVPSPGFHPGAPTASGQTTTVGPSGKVEAVGSAPETIQDAQGNMRNKQTGEIIAQTPYGMPAPNVALAQQTGVPVMPGNPYQGMPAKEAQETAAKVRASAQADLAKSDADAEAQRAQIDRMQQLQALNAKVPTGSDFVSRGARWLAGQGNDANLQTFNQLASSTIPGMRTGAGITRVTNKDMGIFEQMAPSVHNSPEANAAIARNAIAVSQAALEHNRFQHDYLAANGTLEGSEGAWDQYMQANPLFNHDQTGMPVANSGAVSRQQWFQKNTDRGSGMLAPGGGASVKSAAPNPSLAHLEGQTVTQNGQRYLIQNGQAVPVQ